MRSFKKYLYDIIDQKIFAILLEKSISQFILQVQIMCFNDVIFDRKEL